MALCCLQAVFGLLLCAFADAGAMPEINVQYEPVSAGTAGLGGRSEFAKRASQLAAAIGQADVRVAQFGDLVGQALRSGGRKQMSASFLASQLQPVDASRVRKSLAATEPMISPSQAAVNVVVAEDVGAIAETAKYKGMLDQIARLGEDFEHEVAELANVA